MLKMLMPEESQKDFEMISSMMEMMQAASVEQPEQAENDGEEEENEHIDV